MANKWTDKEKELLLMWYDSDDSPTVGEGIEFAHYKLYVEETPAQFEFRSLNAVRQMLGKAHKERSRKWYAENGFELSDNKK